MYPYMYACTHNVHTLHTYKQQYLYNFCLQYTIPGAGDSSSDHVVRIEPGTIVAQYVKPPDTEPTEVRIPSCFCVFFLCYSGSVC